MSAAPATWAAAMPAGHWRDGRPFAAMVQLRQTEYEARQLVADWGGVARPMTPDEAARVRAWDAKCQTHAVAVEAVTLHDGPEWQHLVPGVAPVPLTVRQLAQEAERRAGRRGAAPLPCGGLFDDTARAQQDFFA